jgi:hypothetical protein
MSIPIKIITGTTDMYQIYADDYDQIPSGACLTLHDNLTNTDHDLRSGPYYCNITNTETTSRFSLNISVNYDITVTSNTTAPSCAKFSDGFIIANATNPGTYNYYWKDATNQTIKTTFNKTTADTLSDIPNGLYKVDIANIGTCSNGTESFQIQTVNNTNSFFTPSVLSTVLTNDTAKIDFTNTSINADSYYWLFGDGNESYDANPTNFYTSIGEYPVTLYAINAVCGDTSVYTTLVNVVDLVTAVNENSALNNGNSLVINRDVNGYYTQFNYKEMVHSTISVWNILGEKICKDISVNNASNKKVYIPLEGFEGKLVLITVTCDNGDTIYRKVLLN